MLRLVLPSFLALCVAGCGASAASGPAWPKSAGSMVPDNWEDDGGESLAPRLVSDVEDSEDAELDEEIELEEVEVEAEAEKPAAKTEDKPAEDKPAEASTEETIMIEEDIVIEVE